MSTMIDGPANPKFTPIPLDGSTSFEDLTGVNGLSPRLTEVLLHASRGVSVSWGIPFQIANPLLVQEGNSPVEQAFAQPLTARWLVFLHTSDVQSLEKDASGFIPASPGAGRLNELAAVYVLVYADGSEVKMEIRCRHQVGAYRPRLG
jgi:hypothetical protein